MSERDIFTAARAHTDPAARAAFLTEACAGDTALRERVERLLRADRGRDSLLDVPPVALLELDHPADPDRTANLKAGSTLEENSDEGTFAFLAPPGRPDSLGRLGHYEVLQVLGRGGFGIVFRAFDDTLQRVVAVKVLAPQLAVTSPARKRFVREARSSAKIRHEHVVQVYAVEEQPLPYLVMEFIPGETLQQRLDRTGPLETVEVVRIGRQIAEGLAAAHRMGLIHRDIKPANILIEAGPHPCVKITDFGLARAADDASLTQSGNVAGTPMFMAPEQARGDTLDHRADLFSLGSVLYTMCSGRPPFRANSTLAVLKRVTEDTPRPIPEIIPEVPQWLCEIIARLHAKKPEDRIATAREVADLLGRCLAEMQRPANVPSIPVVAPAAVEEMPRSGEAPAEPAEIPKPAPALKPRFRNRLWAAAAVLLLLVAGFGFTEGTGVTNFRGTVIRLFSPEGTLVVAVDDPGVSIQIDGSDIVITGAGAKEIRLKPGSYTVEASKDGKVVRHELVTVTKNGRQVVRVSQEALPSDEKAAKAAADASATRPTTTIHDTWIKAVAALPLDKQGAAVAAKMTERLPGFDDAFLKAIPAMPADRQVVLVAALLKKRNPGFDGPVTHQIEDSVVTSLEVPSPIVQDLTPLRALTGLRTLTGRGTLGYDNKAESDAAVLLSLKTLEKINGKPVAQFWKEVAARQAEFKEWLQQVPVLTAEQQLEAVAAKLKERNPGFDGKLQMYGDWIVIEGGVVTRLYFHNGENVTDISPVRALVGLKSFGCRGPVLSDLSPLKNMKLTSLELAVAPGTDLSWLKDMKLTSLALAYMPVSDLSWLKDMKLTSLTLSRTQVTDLSLLKGMKLKTLDLSASPVSDLSPLKGIPLTSLSLWNAGVRDLEPLKGMPLTLLVLTYTGVRDLEPLKGMPLTSLTISHTEVKDLSPLKGMPLTYLSFDHTEVKDLSPLKGMPLRTLRIFRTGVTDLKPLQGMPLEEIRVTPKNITQGLDMLRDMKSLKTIGIDDGEKAWLAAEFWARYEKGEFKE